MYVPSLGWPYFYNQESGRAGLMLWDILNKMHKFGGPTPRPPPHLIRVIGLFLYASINVFPRTIYQWTEGSTKVTAVLASRRIAILFILPTVQLSRMYKSVRQVPAYLPPFRANIPSRYKCSVVFPSHRSLVYNNQRHACIAWQM